MRALREARRIVRDHCHFREDYDPDFGWWTKKPKEADDLKKITGVAKVLEGKLHQQGIYTYKQIADWKPAQMDAFGELLSFKNRIQRDDWKKQAKALHKEKHG